MHQRQHNNGVENHLSNEHIIKQYDLTPHPHGCGYFKETFRAPEKMYDEKIKKQRSTTTQIMAFFVGNQISPFHKTHAVQLINHNSGNTNLLIKMIINHQLETIKIGPDNIAAVVPPNTWFALSLENPSEDSRSLTTHTVVPGFEYEDFFFG